MKSEPSLRPPFSMDKLEETHHRAIFPRPPRAGLPRPSVDNSAPANRSRRHFRFNGFFCCGRSGFVCQAILGKNFSRRSGFLTRREVGAVVLFCVRLESLTYELWRPSQAGIEPLFFASSRLCAQKRPRAKTPRRKEERLDSCLGWTLKLVGQAFQPDTTKHRAIQLPSGKKARPSFFPKIA